VVLVAALLAGGPLTAVFDRYQIALAQWVVADRSSRRLALLFVVFVVRWWHRSLE